MARRPTAKTEETPVLSVDEIESIGTPKDRLSVWVMNSKGGVGKTTLSVVVADLMQLSERPLRMLEIDSRKRLSSFMEEGSVLSFEGAPPIEAIRRNPNLVLKHYDPIMTEMEKADCLLDMGANEDPSFLEYCKLSRIDEDLVELGIRTVAMVPTVAESESVRGAIVALQALGEVVPSSVRILVLNGRDQGDFEKYFDKKTTASLAAEGILTVFMPRIISEGWEDFQRMKLRFIDVVAMDAGEIQERFSYSRQFAKRARGDIASWFEQMRQAFAGVLPIIGD